MEKNDDFEDYFDSDGEINFDNFTFDIYGEGTSHGRGKHQHRHTPYQIKELENIFKNCAHPDLKQRREISKRLGLASRQVKFWFQNRRTQMKTQLERNENVSLKQEYDRLCDEHKALKELMRNPICQKCGGQAMLGENARLKDELIRVSDLAERALGRPVSNLVAQIKSTTVNSHLAQPVWRNGSNDQMGAPNQIPPLRFVNFENGSSSNTSPLNGLILTNNLEKTTFMQAGIAAMEELLAMADIESPLWVNSFEEGRELLNYEEYSKKFSAFSGVRPNNLVNDATRVVSSVFITSSQLVEQMMIPRKWKDLFPCFVSKAATIEVLFNGSNGTRDGELQLMNAEIVFPSPFIPARQEKFLRFAKRHAEGMWAVVDVSLEMIRESSYSSSFDKWRRLPSGFIVQDVPNGYSLVTWIEHGEYDENYVHPLYQPLLRSGLAYGAQRWLSTLQRECESAAILTSSRYLVEDTEGGSITSEGKWSVIKLMKRISHNLCAALCTSTDRRWEKMKIEGVSTDVSIVSRISFSEPGEPYGLVLSASTSVWLPVSRQHLFDFLRNEKFRAKWDILSNGGPMEVLSCISMSFDGTNLVSLLCPPAAPARDSSMVIIQQSWSDPTGSFIVYAPVDSSSLDPILKGADSDYLVLLPSGFAISDGPIHPCIPVLTSSSEPDFGGTSVLTMGFQILVNSLPATKDLTIESIETIRNLMSGTIQKIRASLAID